MARPTKLTAELQERICLHLRYGATARTAAEAEGIHEDTFHNWMARHPAFFAAVTRATARARTDKLARLEMAAAKGSVQACTWLLERLDPQAYGEPPKRVALEGPEGGPVVFTITLDRPAGTGEGTIEAGAMKRIGSGEE